MLQQYFLVLSIVASNTRRNFQKSRNDNSNFARNIDENDVPLHLHSRLTSDFMLKIKWKKMHQKNRFMSK